MVTRFEILFLVIAIIMVVSTIRQFSKKRITAAWAMFWSGLWVVGSVLTVFAGWLASIAAFFGNDARMLVVELSIIALFIIAYKLFMRQQKLRQDISKIVEEVAKRD